MTDRPNDQLTIRGLELRSMRLNILKLPIALNEEEHQNEDMHTFYGCNA